jgi:Protein of unknown function (DUF3313)
MEQQTFAPQFHTKLMHAALALVLAIGSVAFSHTADAKKQLPAESPEGLKLLPKTKVSAVYMREGADFSGYDKVAILDCYVAFRKDWKREQNSGANRFKVDDSDITRIKTQLADEFKKVFAKELTAKGQTVVTTGGTGVLVLRPAIINLDVTAPDTMDPGTRSFSASAGQATLYLELFDGVSGELLARAIDAEEAGTPGFIGVRNSVTNRADADRMLKKWADLLGNYLQNARASANSNAAPAK